LASVAGIAAWLVALLDALGLKRAAIAGHSLGSLATLEAAASFPERVSRIALLGPAVPMVVSEPLLTAARDQPEAAYRMIVGWSLCYPRQLGGNVVPGMWLAGGVLRLMERTPPGVLFTDLSACNDYLGGLEAARKVPCPALVLVGGRDLMAPPKAAQALVAALPKRELRTLPEVGHSLMGEAPDEVLDALRGFLHI
jgi:pimeloyl-ACP methyl ester carboxylesterase